MFQLRSACPEEACPAAVTPSRAATANSDTKRTQGIGRQPALSTHFLTSLRDDPAEADMVLADGRSGRRRTSMQSCTSVA
jgi:hypothetical protein